MATLKLSSFTDNFTAADKARYLQKISYIGRDPYLIHQDEFLKDLELLPELSSIDIIAYLVESPSPFTAKNFGAYKSTEAYNQFSNGWLHEVVIHKPASRPELRVIRGKVLHSQAVKGEALQPWVIATDERIYAAHCTCKAGLGEVCTHVSTLLFGVDAGVRLREKKTCTQVKCSWLEPARKEISPAPISCIDFTSAVKKKRKLDAAIDNYEEAIDDSLLSGESRNPLPAQPVVNFPDLADLFSSLADTGVKSAVLSTVEPFAEDFIPPEIAMPFPPILTDLRDPSADNMTYPELLNKCVTVVDSLKDQTTSEACGNVERHTRLQAKSGIWFRYRSGRITASKMKSVCKTNPGYPAMSTIKSVSYPDLYKFSTNATQWGCSHEMEARAAYEKDMKTKHRTCGFKVEDSGLMINPEYPWIGATPDGLVSCQCPGLRGGLGVCEVKCPFCKRDKSIEDSADDPKFCLEHVDGETHPTLKKTHAYYYQVQTQMFVANRHYCDFIVWTENDLHRERIYRDEAVWREAVEASLNFFNVGVLPELVAKYFTRPPVPLQLPVDQMDTEENIWCYCQEEESGKMIKCDNEECILVWFHYDCLKLKDSYKPPKTWYCPECRKMKTRSKKKK